MTLTDPNGESQIVVTNTFGYYLFDNVRAGQTYIGTVSAKGYLFDSQVVTVDDDVAGMNFVALGSSLHDLMSYRIPKGGFENISRKYERHFRYF